MAPRGVEAPRNGGDEPALALDVGGDGPEQGCGGLVGAVGAAEALDGHVRTPAGFEEIVDATFGVGRAQIGVVAAARASGHGEDEDALVALHEGGGLGKIGRRWAVAERQAFSVGVLDAQDAARPAGDLGDGVVTEMLDDLVEGRGDGWQ